jgi:hypothetical protein
MTHGGMKMEDMNVTWSIKHKDGTIEGPFHCANITTNAGRTVMRRQLHDDAYADARAKYIAVSQDDSTPLAADTVLTGEESADGLGRAEATYTGLAGVGQWQLEVVFSYVGVGITVKSEAVFDDATVGNMYYECLLSPTRTLANGDDLTITHTGTCQAA